jgi:hypothetical protein
MAGLGASLTAIEGSFGGGGLVVGAGGLTVGLTGTIGFSISVFGTGGQTRFSNLTEDGLAELGVVSGDTSEVGSSGGGADFLPPIFGLDSHIFRSDEMDPVLFRFSFSSMLPKLSRLSKLSLP